MEPAGRSLSIPNPNLSINDELKEQFMRWYPGLKTDEPIGEKTDESTGLAA